MKNNSMLVGRSVKRINDRKFLQGLAQYVADIKFPGMLYMHVVRSRYVHARIKNIDVSKTYKNGARAVYTYKDIDAVEIDVEEAVEGVRPVYQTILASEKTRYVGEPVAVVVSDSFANGVDAAELVDVVYDPLPPVLDPFKAMAPGSPLVHEELGTNVYFTWSKHVGDVEDVFKKAEEVVATKLSVQRIAPAAMEPRCVVANYNPSNNSFTLYASTQNPYRLRSFVAKKLGVSENALRVIAPDVGGGFGSKLSIYPEDILAPILSKKLRRPVAWFENRMENFHATTHGRDMHAFVELALSRQGRILGLKAEITADIGAYPYGFARGMPLTASRMITGCYKIKNVFVKAVGVFTNKMPIAPYRGAGRPEASYFIERAVERAAMRLGIDPVEIRRINFIEPYEFPYDNGLGMVYDTGDYGKALDRLLEISNYKGLREMQKELRGKGVLIGVGLSTYVEVSNFLPQPAYVRVEKDGSLFIYSGTSPHGQGDETAFAQIASDTLGVPIEKITVTHSDTSLGPPGNGTAGSWTLASGGNAVLAACKRIREKMAAIAAHLLECRAEDLEFIDGAFVVKDDPSRKISVEKIAEAAYDAESLPENIDPGLEAVAHYVPQLTFPFGAHLAVVEVDTETGKVYLRKIVMVNDCGQVVNPMLVDGQVIGGAAQAIGQALFEGLEYDANGTLLTASFADYLIPTAAETPDMLTDRTVTPAPNPLGAKGVGEASTIGLAQAVVNAVEDALGKSVEKTPLTPYMVWSILHAFEK
ncbi:MAG: xanthine dehydrogenase family protein molybdopterin-binding subunit [Candidatus Caldarchaeum sp.]